MYSCSIVSREWKTNIKTLFGIFSLFVIVLIVPRPVDALQTALVRASDGNVYQIRFPNGDLSGGYSISNFIDDFSIYNETGQVELCPGNDQSVTREIYTAARVLAQTPRNTPLFDTSPLAATLEQTAAELGIDQEGNVDVVGIVGDIVKEMAVDELQGQIQTVVDPSLNLGIATINLNTLKIKINASGPDIIVKPTEFLSELVGLEIELRWMLYAFSRASTYANTTIHLQALANQRSAALWDAINAGEVVDITGHAFTIHEDAIEISNKIGVFDPLRLRLAAGVYRAYAEYVAELGTDLAEHEGPVATLANRISVDIITEFLFTLSDAQSAMAEKDALDELDAQIPGDINTRLHANINGIYDSATSDLNQNGFCAPDLRFAAVPLTVPEGDTLTYTVALNSAPGFLAIISISSDNPDVTVSPTSLTFTSNNWYIPKRVGVDVSADADSIDESVSLSHVVAGYGGGMVREFQFDITDQVSNRAPEAIRTIPDQTLTVGDSSAPLDLPTYFHDPDDDTLLYTIESSDPNVATAQGVGSQFTIWTLNVGNTTVTVRAADPDDLFITQTFTITVDPAPLPNQPPEAVNTIPAQNLTLGSASPPLELSTYFHDPDGGTIFYTAESSDRAVATTQRTGSQLTIWPQGIGTATITVTAANSDELSDTQTFTVTVTANETPTQRPIPQGLNIGDSIIVQNTGSIGLTGSTGLNIRSDPQVRNQNPDNRIGLVYDGATGTIIAGPREADGYIWWEVQWDAANNRGWSVEAIGAVGLLARRPPEPVTQSFDLEIQPLSVSKQSLDAGESFTLSITIHNNGPGNSPGPALSYYHSLSPGFSPTDPPQLQGTLSLGPLASGESRTQLIQLEAPATPKTYYYGAWLSANSGDTNLNNDFATELGVTVVDDTIADPVDTSDPPDLVIANISVDYDRMYPGERFTISAAVRNTGGRQAANARVRYYRSSDEIYSTDDEELANTTDFIGRLEGGETSNETANLDAPDAQGVYYYIARAEPVQNEVDTDNNYAAIKITVLPPAAPDLVVTSLTSNRYLVDPGRYFRLDAIIRNQGEENARQRATVRFYRSSDPLPSPDDEEIGTDSIRALRDGSTDDGVENGPAPEQPGTYYYYACVDSVSDERNTDNNCSNVVTINVRGPDLVVYSVSVDYHSRTNTVYPNGIFELDVTVRNQGTEDADDTTLRYYISSDPIRSSDDTEVATDRVNSLDMNETSRTYKSDWIDVPYTSGFFYALVCVDGVEAETDTANNCYTPIKITVTNFGPRAEGTIPEQMLYVGTSAPLDVSAYFVDTNNDDLTYTASSSAPNIVTVGVSGAQVTFTPHRNGSGTITVTASDGEFTATQTFTVSVTAAEVSDLVVDSIRVNRTSLNPGDTFRVDTLIRNQGQAASGTTTVRYYLSSDEMISRDDTELRTAALPSILVDSTTEPWVQLTAPEMPGAYYYGVCVDGVTGESDTTNNCSQAIAITVEGADLRIDGTPQVSKTTLAVGETFQINTRVWNQGKATSSATTLRYYLSTDDTISPEDTEVGSDRVDALSGRGASATRRRAELSETLTAPDTPGTHYYGVCVDSVAGDANTLNNCSQAIAITVEAPPPDPAIPADPVLLPRPEAPDLLISADRVDRSTIKQGQGVRLHITLTNRGMRPAPATKIRFYRSTDATISPEEDTELREVPVGGLGPGKSYTTWALLPSPFAVGVYYYGACLDAVASEFDTTNNCSDTIEITTEAQGTGKQDLFPSGTIETQSLEVGGSPIVLDVSGKFVGKVESYTASSSETSVVTAVMSDSEVTLTPVSEGWSIVTIEASSEDLAAKLTFSVSVGNPATPPPTVPDTTGPDVVDTSPVIWIPDDSLRAAVYDALGLTQAIDLTQQKMQRLTNLVRSAHGVKDLTGLEYATQLTRLNLSHNQISDLTPLQNLTKLTYLNLNPNQIRDITPLRNLTALTELHLANNQISDITPLGNLTNLTGLWLFDNQISDITPLENLTNLTYLRVSENSIRNITPLRNLTALTELHLANNQIKSACTYISSIIKSATLHPSKI